MTGRPLYDAAPGRGRSRVSDFMVFIVLPLLLTGLAMTLGAYWLLNGIAASVNAQEEKRTWQAVQSGIIAFEDRLAGIASDNAHWDDAVRRTYGTLDAKWVSEMWGVGSADVNYDTMFLLAPGGRALTAFRNGAPFGAAPADYLGALLPKLEAFAAGQKDFATLSTLATTRDGLAIVTAAPVMPTTAGIDIGQPVPNLAVFINHISPEEISTLGQQYIVDGLTLTPAGAAADRTHLLTDRWNAPVAAAQWTPRNPGEIARASYRSSVLGALLGLFLVLVPLTVIYFRRSSELEESQRQALHAARHDTLTGLLNRNAFVSEMEALRGDGLGLLLIDVSDIRDINDSFGLKAGDEVLKTMTERLTASFGGSALLSRFGGSSFAVALPGGGAAAAVEEAAARAISGLAGPVGAAGHSLRLAVNIGAAADAQGRSSPSELVLEADLALHHARQAGPDEWRRFDQALDMRPLAEAAQP